MKQRMLCALLALTTALALLPLYAAADAGGDPQWITVPLASPTSRGGVYEWDFPYSDAFFSASAQAYQHPLAQSSLGLAISAFRQKSDTLAGRDEAARAFLSDRYRRIDNAQIASATLPILAEMDGVQIESCEVTENRMYLKAVNKRLEAEVVPGDVVQAGIMISNSEVGLGSVSVMPLVYRLVCLNGMVVNDLSQKKYHIGREQESTWELFSDEAIAADDQAFMLKLRDIVRSATEEARFNTIVDRLRETTGVPITGSVPKVIELTGERFGFNCAEQDGVLQHLIAGGDLSLYGLSNAVTRASQDAETYDRATMLESAGWQIATMPRDTWNAINAGR